MTSASDIYIEATETDPAVQAQATVRTVHQRLRTQLTALIGQPDPAELTGFCTGELRRHLGATDETLYAAASGSPETRLLVRALRTTSAALDQRIDALSSAEDAAQTAAAAQAIETALAVHLAVEQEVLLPALAALPGADLPLLVTDLNVLLSGGQLKQQDVIDVREIPHNERHPRIFARYSRLAPGEGFTLVSNHDPKPLRRQFEAAYPGAFTWDYLQPGPDVWRLRIGRPATAS